MASGSQLQDRVALVTGASGGIGSALARRLADAGAAVALSYAAHAEPAERLAREIAVSGGRAVALHADVATAAAPGDLVDAVERELGPVAVLVANAGTGSVTALEDVDLDTWDRTVAVNLRAPFLLAQRVVPGMRSAGFGRILFVSSVAAFTGGIVGPHYAASKSGLHGLTHFLASRLAPEGITVNTVAPALIEETGMLPAGSDQLRDAVPVRRLGRPDEVASLAMEMLVNAYMTNQVVLLDGGIYPH